MHNCLKTFVLFLEYIKIHPYAVCILFKLKLGCIMCKIYRSNIFVYKIFYLAHPDTSNPQLFEASCMSATEKGLKLILDSIKVQKNIQI